MNENLFLRGVCRFFSHRKIVRFFFLFSRVFFTRATSCTTVGLNCEADLGPDNMPELGPESDAELGPGSAAELGPGGEAELRPDNKRDGGRIVRRR